MKMHCCDSRRLEVLRAGGTDNAIEFVEVLDRAAPPSVPRQRTLLVRLLRPGFALTTDNLRISGGERIRTVGIVWAGAGDALPAEAEPALAALLAEPGRTLVVRTDSEGDYSQYTLAIVADIDSDRPPAGFDPILSTVAFSFKVECRSDFDCGEARTCPPEARERPTIDYLAKDYPGFCRLMLDRMALLAPGWTERSAADVGVTLVELLAYAADNLSYRQDAIANEAYLNTARKRVSVRRHVRLVDYHLHDGCNARVWVQVRVEGAGVVIAAGTPLFTRTSGVDVALLPGSLGERRARGLEREPRAEVFETAASATLDERCNELRFYTWGDAGCCLPMGSTSATLRGLPPIAVGDVLVLEEVASPTTFADADADRSRRWAVRLTAVAPDVDPSGQLFDTPPVNASLDVTRIEWDRADALPFALCLGVRERPGLAISVARGNIVLADHGDTRGRADDEREDLGVVPSDTRRYAPAPRNADRCERSDPNVVRVRYRPSLQESPVTHGFELAALLAALPNETQPFWPASLLLPLDVRAARPLVWLTSTLDTQIAQWSAVRDLLGSDANATHFVVETEYDGRSLLRFGDDVHGRRPNADTAFRARYRIGNGRAGNVGAEAIAHLVIDSRLYENAADIPDPARILLVRNPLPAAGGVEPEDVEAARRDAPEAFRTQERAVTPADYAAAAERSGEVERAAATFRWTGSWHTVFVTADRPGGTEVDAPFEARLRRHLERFRMAGYDLEVDAPRMVPLDVSLHICVKPGHFRSAVLAAVRRVLGAERLTDGALGVFHPDNFSFGDPVYLSHIVAAAQAVEGVDSVRVDRFQRLIAPSATSLYEGVIRTGRLEIAQLANNPNFRERGRLALAAAGGL